MNLNSKKFSGVTYEKGENIFLSPDEFGFPFYFIVKENLTSNEEAMKAVAAMLDEVDTLKETAYDFLKKTLANKKSEYYQTVAYFMEFHREEIGADIAAKLFPVDNPTTIPYIEMVDYLKINSFDSFIDNELKQQAFIMDLCFNPEITDELLVIYFNLEKQIYCVAHES